MFLFLFLFLSVLAQTDTDVDTDVDTGETGPEPAKSDDITESGCKDSHEDCNDEVLICSTELNEAGTEVTFNELKVCIYRKVSLDKAEACCQAYVEKNQVDDPWYRKEMKFTAAPVTPGEEIVTKNGDPADCRKQYSSTNCLEWGPCRWEYWTRVCRPIKFDAESCYSDNRDCKDELQICIQREKEQGRAPALRNLEPCVIMNKQSDCCQLYTNKVLSLKGPKRKWRPDRYDLENCELYKRNSACKNQPHCLWHKKDKSCYPMPGIRASGLWYIPEMSCGYKGFKLFFKDKVKVLKRNVKTSCDCALYCEDYEHWVWRQTTTKCGCTDSPVRKVARERKGFWGSDTKHAPRRESKTKPPSDGR